VNGDVIVDSRAYVAILNFIVNY